MRNYVRTILASATLTAGILAVSSPAAAAVQIKPTSSFVQPEENVQLDTDLVLEIRLFVAPPTRPKVR